MLYNEYEKILTKGKRVNWYDTQVPEKLITDIVKAMANQIVDQINKYEGVDSNSKKDYICNLWENVKNLPYTMNGDFYLIKKKEIESKQKKPKINKNVKEPKEEIKKVTKNSGLIFGNKTK
jgi:hypothetical protein